MNKNNLLRIKRMSIVLGLVCAVTACGKKQPQEQPVVDLFTEETTESLPVVIKGSEEPTENNEELSEEIGEDESVTETTQESEEIVAFVDKNYVEYDVIDECYENEAVVIQYPQITGMEDVSLQNKINENIKKFILMLDKPVEEYSSYEFIFEVGTKGTGIFSVLFYGYENTKTAAYPKLVVKTLNIDMTNGENLRLKDYADYESIISCLETDSGYNVVSGNMTNEEFSLFINNGYMTDYAMTMLDYDFDFSNEYMIPTGYSYIQDNRVHILVEVEHAAGDYTEVCFDKTLTER